MSDSECLGATAALQARSLPRTRARYPSHGQCQGLGFPNWSDVPKSPDAIGVAPFNLFERAFRKGHSVANGLAGCGGNSEHENKRQPHPGRLPRLWTKFRSWISTHVNDTSQALRMNLPFGK